MHIQASKNKMILAAINLKGSDPDKLSVRLYEYPFTIDSYIEYSENGFSFYSDRAWIVSAVDYSGDTILTCSYVDNAVSVHSITLSESFVFQSATEYTFWTDSTTNCHSIKA